MLSFKKSINSLTPQDDYTQSIWATLDGFRVFGMTLVIIGHTLGLVAIGYAKHENIPLLEIINQVPWYMAWVANAHLMVDLFFIFSGFLISNILFREQEKTGRINVSRFYFRRFMRLMPVYLVVCILFYLGGIPNKETIWRNLLYINNFWPHREGAADWTWSLAVEEQFYVLFPLFLMLFPKKNAAFFVTVFSLYVLSFVIRFLIVMNNELFTQFQIYDQLSNEALDNAYLSELYDNLYTRFGAFMCGIMVAYLYRYKREQVDHFFNVSKLGPNLLLLAYVFFVFFVFMVWQKKIDMPQGFVIAYYTGYRNLFSLVFVFVILALLVRGKYTFALVRLFTHRMYFGLAQLVYSAYLIHIPCVAAACFFTHFFITKSWFDQSTLYIGSTFFIGLILGCILTYFMSFLIYSFIENPMLAYRDKKTGKSFRQASKNETQ
ncbi:MAG: acyltransferase [Pseudomonadota bacterium]